MRSMLAQPIAVRALALSAVAALLVTLVAVVGPVSADPPGNNGTIKVHDNNPGEPDPEVKNQPHVCQFDLHFFFGDAGQTGDWWIQEWPPTSDTGPTSDPAGAELSGVYEDPDLNREDREPDVDGTYYTLPDGHYKLFWEGALNPGGQQNIKHKVFWVDCPEQVNPQPVTAAAASVTPPSCTAAGMLVVPANTASVTYSVSPAYSAGATGTFTVTATANAGFVLTGTSQWTLTVLAQLSGAAWV